MTPEKTVRWGPELSCPRCQSKDWLLIDKGAVCPPCYEGVSIKIVCNYTIAAAVAEERKRAAEIARLEGGKRREDALYDFAYKIADAIEGKE